MMDSTSVISLAVDGIVKELAHEYGVSLTRMYELLGKDNSYPKTKKLIRRIGRHSQPGARLIKADLDAMFADILEEAEEPSLEDMHRECYEAVDSVLRNRPLAEQKTQVLELLEICQRKLRGIERKLQPVNFGGPIDTSALEATRAARNGK